MWKKLIGASAAIALSTSFAIAQSSPNLRQGQVLTPAQWNQLFINKQDVLGFTPLNSAGGVMSGRLVTSAPGASTSGLNLTPGTTPGSPANGDLWVTSSGFFARVNGVTIGPIGGATSSSFAATTPIGVSFPAGVVTYACATCGVTGSPLSQFASTTSAQLLGVLSDESGTGLAVFNNGPTLIAPILGAATATSINKVAITAPASSATLTIADGKTAAFSNSLTFTGTDGNSIAFPSGGGTVDIINAAQTLTNKTITASSNVLGGVTLTLGSDATGDTYYRNSGGVLTRVPIGSTGQVWTVSGGLPSWQPGAAAASINVGTTTISGTCSASQLLFNSAGTTGCQNQSASLTAGGGITLSGTTNVTITQRTPTVQVLTSGSGATYTPAAGAAWIHVRGCGGGGGSGSSVGGTGGTTTFSLSSMSATGGAGSTGTSGGAAAGGTGTNGQINYAGGNGVGTITGVSGYFGPALLGGASFMFPAYNGAAPANTCAGAGGVAGTGATSYGGAGAGGGGFERWMAAASATYTIGAGGTAGTGGSVGGSGVIIVVEY